MRLRSLAALLLPLTVACQRPHVCTAACEQGLVSSAPEAALPPAEPAAAAPVQAAAAPAVQALDPAAALAAFDQAWQEIHDSHFDPTFNGVDWDALKLELRPRAEQAKTREELRAVIGEMLGRLGQSHFAVIPSDALPAVAGAHDESGGLGFDVRLRDGHLWVVSLEPNGAAAAAGVKTGWSVTRLGDFDVEKAVAKAQAAAGLGARQLAFRLWAVAHGSLNGPVGGHAAVSFLDGDEHAVELDLERRKRDVTAHEFGPTLPTFYLEFASAIVERAGKRIGTLRFSNWFLPVVKPIDDAMETFRALDGVVLDLRGNTGGAAAMTMRVAGHFFAESKTLGVMSTRDSKLNILAFPRTVNAAGEMVTPFAGPLAIVIDETTGSASEVFAGGMQALGRARVFGETSAGAVLPAVTTVLSNGDTLLHALGDFETSTGVRLEGRGVVPDVVVPLERAKLLAGHDAPLEAALDWIANPNH